MDLSIQVVKEKGVVSPEELAYNVGLGPNYLPLILHGIGSISGGEIVYAGRKLMTKSMFQELAARHKPEKVMKKEASTPTPTPQTPETPPREGTLKDKQTMATPAQPPSEKVRPPAVAETPSISWQTITRPYYELECRKGHGRKLKQLAASVETYSEAGERRAKYGRFQCDICQVESVYDFAKGTWLDG